MRSSSRSYRASITGDQTVKHTMRDGEQDGVGDVEGRRPGKMRGLTRT